MKILKSIKDRFVLLCICEDDTSTVSVRLKNIIISVVFFGLLVANTIASFFYVKKYYKIDFEDSLFAVFTFSGIGAAVYIMINAFVLRHEITKLFAAFQSTYDASMNKDHDHSLYSSVKTSLNPVSLYADVESDPKKFMQKADERCEKTFLYFYHFMTICLANLLGFAILSCLISWLKFGYFDADFLYRPYRFL